MAGDSFAKDIWALGRPQRCLFWPFSAPSSWSSYHKWSLLDSEIAKRSVRYVTFTKSYFFFSFLRTYYIKWSQRAFSFFFSFQIDCDGVFIGFSFKLLILLFGSWALFFRPTKATMPRIYLFRACICTLLFIFIFAFWLFYGVRVFDEQRQGILYYLG